MSKASTTREEPDAKRFMHYKVDEYLGHQYEKGLRLMLYSNKGFIYIYLLVDREKIEEIEFSFDRGTAEISGSQIKYKFCFKDNRREIIGYEKTSIKKYEEQVMPYLEKIRYEELDREEAEKIYDSLIKIFEDELKNYPDLYAVYRGEV